MSELWVSLSDGHFSWHEHCASSKSITPVRAQCGPGDARIQHSAVGSTPLNTVNGDIITRHTYSWASNIRAASVQRFSTYAYRPLTLWHLQTAIFLTTASRCRGQHQKQVFGVLCRCCRPTLIASLRSPYGIGQTIIFSCCFFFLLSFFISSPHLSGQRLDVYHTSTHGVALVRI